MSDPSGSLALLEPTSPAGFQITSPSADRSASRLAETRSPAGGDALFTQVLEPGARPEIDLAGCDSVEAALAAGVELPCHSVDPDLFFAESPLEVERAKSLCRGCPVRGLCLDAALERREPWGVWGGEWFDGGQAIGRKRPRGRPRKVVVAA